MHIFLPHKVITAILTALCVGSREHHYMLQYSCQPQSVNMYECFSPKKCNMPLSPHFLFVYFVFNQCSLPSVYQSINQYYFIVRKKVDNRAGQLKSAARNVY